MNFHDWIKFKYLEWSDNKKSENQFARYLGISQATVNAWFNRTRGQPTSKAIINKLADKLGVEVYEVLGLSVPGLTSENSQSLFEATSEFFKLAKENGLSEGDPKFTKLFIEVFSKHGIKAHIID